MGFSDLPWSKILATLFGVALAGVELWEYKRKRQNLRWKKRKKLISISLISGLLISTLWSDVSEENKNILQEETRNDNIVKDSIRLENLSKRTDVIINNVGYAVQGIEESKSVLLLLDSMTVTTNERLDLAIEKSKELVELETIKFNLGRPNIEILSSEVQFVPDSVDSTKLNITYKIRNSSIRTAKEIRYNCVLVLYNNEENLKNFYTTTYDYITMDELSGNSKNETIPLVHFKITKDEVLSKYKNAIFITRTKYKDEFDNQEFDENSFFSADKLVEGVLHFHEPSESQKYFSTRYLMDYKMGMFFTDSTIKKYN